LVRFGKTAAAVLLVASVLLPIYSVGDDVGEARRMTYAWELARGDLVAVFTLAIVYLWPVVIFGLSRVRSRRLQILIQFAEPALAVTSSIIVLYLTQLIFESRRLFLFLLIPLNSHPQWGCYLAVAANGLYLASWLAGLLRPWAVQEG
jgi:hypothetical protein